MNNHQKKIKEIKELINIRIDLSKKYSIEEILFPDWDLTFESEQLLPYVVDKYEINGHFTADIGGINGLYKVIPKERMLTLFYDSCILSLRSTDTAAPSILRGKIACIFRALLQIELHPSKRLYVNALSPHCWVKIVPGEYWEHNLPYPKTIGESLETTHARTAHWHYTDFINRLSSKEGMIRSSPDLIDPHPDIILLEKPLDRFIRLCEVCDISIQSALHWTMNTTAYDWLWFIDRSKVTRGAILQIKSVHEEYEDRDTFSEETLYGYVGDGLVVEVISETGKMIHPDIRKAITTYVREHFDISG